MGQAGIVNIERESHLSGSIHDKECYFGWLLRNRFGQNQPLALSASLCFEQSYSGVEGDSASSRSFMPCFRVSPMYYYARTSPSQDR
jgi:predicted ATP-dependent protease